jgi:hypothetical protein
MKRDSFVMFTDDLDILDALPDEQAAKLMRVIRDYMKGIEPDLSDPVVNVAFFPIKKHLDDNYEKWCATREERSKSGKMGAEARWGKRNEEPKMAKMANAKNDMANIANAKNDMAKMANDSKAWQSMAKMAVYVNDNVNVNVNDNENVNNITPLTPLEGEKESPKKKFNPKDALEERITDEKLKASIEQWLKYKSERREGYKETGFKKLLSEIENNVKAYGVDAVISVIDKSIARNYKGIIFEMIPRSSPQPRGATDFSKFV